MSDATEINEPIERLEATQSFLQRAGKMLIGGQWVDSASGKKFKTINPATGDQLAEGIRRMLTEPLQRQEGPLRILHGAI